MDIEELKKDVEDFGKGVKRLEQLEVEFNKINTSGHKEEAEEISHMLKNVSTIPQLEARIAKLKSISYKDNGFKYKFNRKLPLVVKKYNQFTLKNKPQVKNSMERKYEFLIKKNNDKIFNEINGIKGSIKSLVNSLGTVKTQVLQQNKNLKSQKTISQYKKIKSKKIIKNIMVKENGESRKFFKCRNLLLRVEIAIQNKDKLKAKNLYLKLRNDYSKIGYLEKKKIYNKLLKSYYKVYKLYHS